MGNKIDLINQKFERLLVVEFIGIVKKHSRYKCLCDCGNYKETTLNALRSGKIKSCGCLNYELISNRNKTHGLSKHPLFTSWIGMRNRCLNIKHNRAKNYIGKGVSICNEWANDFMSFYNWSIKNGWEKGLSIDRINNNGNYEPSNCKFSNNKQQSRNRSSNVIIEIDGLSKTAIEWAESEEINVESIYRRIKKGYIGKTAIYGVRKFPI
jgi:hypothetical protein